MIAPTWEMRTMIWLRLMCKESNGSYGWREMDGSPLRHYVGCQWISFDCIQCPCINFRVNSNIGFLLFSPGHRRRVQPMREFPGSEVAVGIGDALVGVGVATSGGLPKWGWLKLSHQNASHSRQSTHWTQKETSTHYFRPLMQRENNVLILLCSWELCWNARPSSAPRRRHVGDPSKNGMSSWLPMSKCLRALYKEACLFWATVEQKMHQSLDH